MSEACTHDGDELALVCSWILNEVRKAVNKGYTVLHVYEFYEYAVTRYVSQTGEGGLFVEYINTFLKLKVDASRHPDLVCSEQDQDHYISVFYKVTE